MTYCNNHAVIFLDSAATSEERDQEDDDADDYHENRCSEEPIVDKVTVAIVQSEYYSSNGYEHDTSDL